MRSIATDGIIIGRRDLGEFDQSVTVFSPKLGKIRANARGVRKPGSRFAGHLEPLNVCEFLLHRSARGYTIIQSQSVRTFRPIRASLKKSLSAMLVLEIFESSIRGQEQGRELYSLLSETLEALNAGTNNPLIIDCFKIKLMMLIGILPEIERCSLCRTRWSAATETALTSDNHLVCDDCLGGQSVLFRVPFNVIKLASYACGASYADIGRIRTSGRDKAGFKKTADSFLHLYLNREIVAERILGTF
jgi:DNA repair protein RecO (recombination protein O)